MVTAIEVLEHLTDPMPVLHTIATVLRPGGILFVTTGNAAPHRAHLDRWSYVVPDVHVSFYERRAHSPSRTEPSVSSRSSPASCPVSPTSSGTRR